MILTNIVYLYVHIIWVVHDRAPLLSKPLRNVLFSHIKGMAEKNFFKILIINGVEDHVHCLLQLHPTQSLSQVVKNVKENSSQWLNENKLLTEAFEWQDGYAAYSVSPSAVKQVTDYILKQEEHHKLRTLDNELEAFEKFKVDEPAD